VASKPGRNDPCPCESGKKYKKCCLTKDEALARAAPAVARSPAPLPIDAAHDVFPRAPARSLEAELAEARSYADPSRPLDPEFAVDELSGVVERLIKAGRAAEARALLAEIEPHQTEAFQLNAPYVALWRMECALALDDGTDLAAARTLGPEVENIPELVEDLVHRLAWEGRDEALSLLLETALPGIRRKRDEWIGSFDSEWLDRTLVVSLGRLLHKEPELSPEDPRIQSLLATLGVKDDDLTDDDLASLLRLARPNPGVGPGRNAWPRCPKPGGVGMNLTRTTPKMGRLRKPEPQSQPGHAGSALRSTRCGKSCFASRPSWARRRTGPGRASGCSPRRCSRCCGSRTAV
jgi:hypothetical protein